MKLFDIGFLSVGVIDIIDIVLVALLIFGLYKIVKGSLALNIFAGFLTIYIIWFIVRALNMRLLSTILNQFISVGMIALLIIFQQEIRRFLLVIGKNRFIFASGAEWRNMLPWNWKAIHSTDINFDEIARACMRLSSTNTGALIILARSSELKFYAGTGIPIEGELSAKLLESIFNKKSPLHDGAVIVVKNRIKAASCILPVSEREDVPGDFGLRHRSAMGISEQTDAMAIVVSEETGNISIANKGDVFTDLSHEGLPEFLLNAYLETEMV